MIRIVLCGYGRMGKLIHEVIRTYDDMKLVMIVDSSNAMDLYKLKTGADLLIDFSHPDNLELIVRYVRYSGCALLTGTTGFSEKQLCYLQELSAHTRVMAAANYSFGMAVMIQLIAQMTPCMQKDFDIEIVEAHHRKKQDAPSGTAYALLEAADPYHDCKEIHGRNGRNMCREGEIGIHAIRGGSIAGEHTVLYLGEDEYLEIKHSATSRRVFANGAIKAAIWLLHQPCGWYTMKHMMKDII